MTDNPRDHVVERLGDLSVCLKCGMVMKPNGKVLFTLTPEQLALYLRLSKKADEMGEKP